MKRLRLSMFCALCFMGLYTNVLGRQNENPSGLTSDDWRTRAAAYSSMPKTAQSQPHLIALLELENKVIASTLKESNGNRGVSAKLGEDYSEYYSDLYGAVLEIAKKGDAHAVAALADGAFDVDSQAASLLAQRWDITLPVFIERTNELAPIRAQAFRMLGLLALSNRGKIPAEQLIQVKNAVRRGLSDQNPSVRIAAVRAVGDGRFVEFLDEIRQISNHDQARDGSNQKTRYPVRDEAKKALRAIASQ